MYSLVNNAGIAYKMNSTASAIEQATVTVNTNFTVTLNMMRAFNPIVREHGRIVNVAAFNGHLSRLSSQSLRDRFSNPELTEEELVALMEEFIREALGEGMVQYFLFYVQSRKDCTHYGVRL